MFKLFIFLSLVCLSLPSRADDWGCQVALCMANPAGPMAVSECVGPIQRLYNALAKHQGWPSCGLAQAPNSPAPQFAPVAPVAPVAPAPTSSQVLPLQSAPNIGAIQ